MTHSRLAATLLTLIAGVGACGRQPAVRTYSTDPVALITDGFDERVRRDVERLRSVTSRFRDLSAAGSAGYPTTLPSCVADSTMGGMGYHLIDRTLVDDRLEIDRPEMLIYAPVERGKVELVGFEFVIPYRAHAATEKPPRLFGQELRRWDQFNYWALHVWAWRRNPAGLFADWNPTVKC